jgi:hypothetical protein
VSDVEYVPPNPYGFVKIRHPDTGGEGEVPPSTLVHWQARGWELVEPAAEAEPEPSTTSRAKRATKKES